MTDKDIIQLATDFKKSRKIDMGNETVTQWFILYSLQSVFYYPQKVDFYLRAEVAWFKVPFQNGNWEHSVLQLSDGRILDLFADKFNDGGNDMPEIYLGTVPEWYIKK